MKVAVLQMLSGLDRDTNLEHAQLLLTQAAQAGAQLALLPENFAQMGKREEDKLSIAEAEGSGPIQAMLSRAAAEHQMWIIGGTIPLRTSHNEQPPRVYAHVPVYAPDGKCVASYDKLHLFDVQLPNAAESYHESRSIAPGARISTAELTAISDSPVTVGLSVCYDLRFPELYRQLTLRGAKILVVPSAFTHATGKAHWQILLQARAIENQCFVLAANQGGDHENGRRTYGHSLIIDPWGDILASVEYGEAVVIADLDFAAQEKTRRNFPVLQHQRISIGNLDD